MAASKNEDWRVSPTELLEQAFHLMRSLKMAEVVPCLIGPVPFVLALLFFWSDMTRAGGAMQSAGAWSLALALLYGWMKAWQAQFARLVWNRLLPEGGAPVAGTSFRQLCALWFLSALSLPVQFIAVNVLVPFGWVYAVFQNAIVLALTQDFGPRGLRGLLGASLRQSHHEPLQNHLVLLLLIIFGLLVWASVFQLGVLVPFLLRALTGVETEFTRNPNAAFLNTLFLATTVAVAWLIVSPFARLVYVLRNFYALSRNNGADLLSRLHAIRRPLGGAVVALVFASPLWAQESAEAARAAKSPSPPAAQLRENIRQTLKQREYQWKLPREHAAAEQQDDNIIESFFRRTLAAVKGFLSDVDRTIKRWWEKVFRRALPTPSAGGAGFNPSALRGLVYLLVSALVLLLIVVVVAILKHRRRRVKQAASATTSAPGIDLESEDTVASQLSEDQWLVLARHQIAAGDLRLAVRAVFLASLASLGEQHLVEIVRSKSNRDYRDELQLRQRSQTDIIAAFGENMSVFERVWYGLHRAGDDMVEQLMANYQRIKGAPSS